MDYQVSQHQPQQHNDLPNSTEQATTTNNTTANNILMNTDLLAFTMDKLAKSMDIQHIDPHSVMYLALATQHRLDMYLRHMIEASQHRIHSQSSEHYKVTQVQDIRKQLLAMERVDREEERRRRQALADREHNANQADGHDDATMDDDDEDGGKKKKKKKKDMGPGAAARNMSEDVYKQATNKTALMLAGGVRKSWMLAGTTSSATSTIPTKPLPPLSSTPLSSDSSTTSNRGRPRGRKPETGKRSRKRNEGGMVLPPSMIGRQPSGRGQNDMPARKVTLVDAMYALEQELDSGCESGSRALIRSYNQYLK